jgi:hypothetical protein
MLKLKLPFWNDQKSSLNWEATAQGFWQKIETGLRWPLTQTDPENCTLAALNLMAWQRDITRFNSEPISLFRKRVRYAYANAADAGSVAGIKRIFIRLGVGYVEVEERSENKGWDVITLRLSDGQLASNTPLLQVLIAQYGRTCRRYEFETITVNDLHILVAEFGNDWAFDVASF